MTMTQASESLYDYDPSKWSLHDYDPSESLFMTMTQANE